MKKKLLPGILSLLLIPFFQGIYAENEEQEQTDPLTQILNSIQDFFGNLFQSLSEKNPIDLSSISSDFVTSAFVEKHPCAQLFEDKVHVVNKLYTDPANVPRSEVGELREQEKQFNSELTKQQCDGIASEWFTEKHYEMIYRDDISRLEEVKRSGKLTPEYIQECNDYFDYEYDRSIPRSKQNTIKPGCGEDDVYYALRGMPTYQQHVDQWEKQFWLNGEHTDNWYEDCRSLFKQMEEWQSAGINQERFGKGWEFQTRFMNLKCHDNINSWR